MNKLVTEELESRIIFEYKRTKINLKIMKVIFEYEGDTEITYKLLWIEYRRTWWGKSNLITLSLYESKDIDKIKELFDKIKQVI